MSQMSILGFPNIKQMQQKGDIEGLAQALRHAGWLTRDKAARALGELGDPRAVEYFIDTLASPSSAVRLLGVRALEKLSDPQVVTPLIAACKDPASDVRCAAIHALQTSKDTRAIAPLLSACSDSDSDVRLAAAQALQALKNAGYEAQIEQIAREVPELSARWADNASLEPIEDQEPLSNEEWLDEEDVLIERPQYHSPLYRGGIALIVIGGFFLFLAFRGQLLFDILRANQPYLIMSANALRVTLSIVGAAALYIGATVANRARRVEISKKSAVPLDDQRPPILYLRSFRDDPITAKRGGKALTAWIRPSEYIITEEEQLAYALNKFGPFMAIGRPGEKLPEIGAVRLYVEADAWQQTVMDLMQQARLVVLRTGLSRGLWWEIQRAVEVVPCERLLFVVSLSGAHYEAFRKQAEQYLPCKLPHQIAPEPRWFSWPFSSTNFQSLKGLIYFDAGWIPHYLVLDHLAVKREMSGRRLGLVLRNLLHPILARTE